MEALSSIWNGASGLLLAVLEFLYGITNSFGLAIVLYDFNQASTLPLKPETDGQYAANAEDTAAIEGNSREIRQRQGK